MLMGTAEYRSVMEQFLLCLFCLIPIFMGLSWWINKRRHKRDQVALATQVKEAIDKILEDGIVEGPKGPYVPHTPWGVGTECETHVRVLPARKHTEADHGHVLEFLS
jgi:hypothetical protein